MKSRKLLSEILEIKHTQIGHLYVLIKRLKKHYDLANEDIKGACMHVYVLKKSAQ